MNTRLDSPPVRTPEAVYRRLVEAGAQDPIGKPGFLRDLVYGTYELAPRLRLSPDWAIAQGCLESGHPTKGHPPFVSEIYRERGMHVGMGVTDSHDLGYGFDTGMAAIEGQLAHLYLYCYGTELPAGLEYLQERDPRWDAVIAKGWEGSCETVDDLAGKWATDREYGRKLRERFAIYIEGADRTVPTAGDGTGGATPPPEGTPAMPTKLTMDKGLIPLPKHERKIVGAKNTGVSWVGQRTIQGDTIHRMQGSFVSAYYHFSNPNVASLTDWGLDHMSGTLWLYNDPKGTRTGWASGPYKGGYGDGRAFAEKYIPLMGIGAEVINRDRESVEISGYFRQPGSSVATDSPWSEASMRVLAQLHASRAHDYGIAWGDYPIALPTDDFSFLAWHQEFILPEYSTESWDKVCPGREVMEKTAQLIEITRGIMKSYQEVSEPTPEQPAEPVPGLLLYPQGMDTTIAAAAFGRVKGDDGREYGFDERGPVSRLWLDIGWAGGDASRFPELVSVQHVDDRKYFRFSDGLLIWQPSADEAVRVIGSEAPDDRAA